MQYGITHTEITTEEDRILGTRRILTIQCTRHKQITLTQIIEQKENLFAGSPLHDPEPVDDYQSIPDDLAKNIDLAHLTTSLNVALLHLPGLTRI